MPVLFLWCCTVPRGFLPFPPSISSKHNPENKCFPQRLTGNEHTQSGAWALEYTELCPVPAPPLPIVVTNVVRLNDIAHNTPDRAPGPEEELNNATAVTII